MKPFPAKNPRYTRRPTWVLRLLAAALTLALLAAACGDSSGDDAATTTAAGQEAATTTAPTTTESPAATTTEPVTTQAPAAPTENLTRGCVEDYAEGVDYFPQKLSVDDAERLDVTYADNYKVVEVSDANFEEAAFTYVLVQCGTPAPELSGDLAGATVVEVPIDSAVVMSTTMLPGLSEIDRLDVVKGLDSFDYVSTPAVLDLIDSGELVATGSLSFGFDAEAMAAAEPDVAFTFLFGPAADELAPLEGLDIPAAVSADYRENTPLGRAEWMKFPALFLNEEAAITELYDGIAADYDALVQTAAGADTRPTVLLDKATDGVWNVAGGDSYAATFISDAGGDYIFSDVPGNSGEQLDIETVLERASDADFWLNPGFGVTSLLDLEAADPRHGKFAAFERGDVWNNDLRVNANFGNDYFETGAAHPELVLGDLVAILHPDLAPDHEFVFYRRLQ